MLDLKSIIAILLFILLPELLIATNKSPEVGYILVTYDEGRTYNLEPNIKSRKVSIDQDDLMQSSNSNYIKVFEKLDSTLLKVFGDSDHDGRIEMFELLGGSSDKRFRITEFNTDLSYVISEIPANTVDAIIWNIDDIDGNGLTDMIVQGGEPHPGINGYLRIYESPTPSSFPSILKWSEVIPYTKGYYYTRVVDIDLDGRKEILISANVTELCNDCSHLRIYKWINGQLVLMWRSKEIKYTTYEKAIADFDADGKMEIATVDLPPSCISSVYVYEYSQEGNFNLTQLFTLPNAPQAYARAIEEINVNGESPVFVVGEWYEWPEPTNFSWTFYKSFRDDHLEIWYTKSFISGVFPGTFLQIVHTKGDYDNDGFEEIVVSNQPNITMLKWVNGEIMAAWSRIANQDEYALICYSYDLRGSSYQDLILLIGLFQPIEHHPLEVWEEERLANVYLNKSLDIEATSLNNQRTLVGEMGSGFHLVFSSGGQIFYRKSNANGSDWILTKRLSQADGCKYPAITKIGNTLISVWQQQNGSNYDIVFSRSTVNG